MTPSCLTALELFCGIGGFAAAVAGTNVRVTAALDQNAVALDVYRLNFPGHDARQINLEKITADELAGFDADLWWLSPPCQPYSVRGRQQDLADPRAQSLTRILAVFPDIPREKLPRYLALENVNGFARSQACERLMELLKTRQFEIRERLLCPTELGIPSRRPRYYLVASRFGMHPHRPVAARHRPLSTYLDTTLTGASPAELLVSPEVVYRFGEGFRILDPADAAAYTTCFTAGYGKSLMHAGSYLHTDSGVRRFAPHEIARLLDLPANFRFPETMSMRKRWQLLGNSLSVVAAREVFSELPGVGFHCQSS